MAVGWHGVFGWHRVVAPCLLTPLVMRPKAMLPRPSCARTNTDMLLGDAKKVLDEMRGKICD